MEGEPRSGCPFCGDRVEKRMIAEEGTVMAVRDKYPVTDLHTLIVIRGTPMILCVAINLNSQ